LWLKTALNNASVSCLHAVRFEGPRTKEELGLKKFKKVSSETESYRKSGRKRGKKGKVNIL
jgi:hypothetical protein